MGYLRPGQLCVDELSARVHELLKDAKPGVPVHIPPELLQAIDEAARAASLPAIMARRRMEWLHSAESSNVDGYEWGIFRVKWENGRAVEVWQTDGDLSDLDAAMVNAMPPTCGNGCACLTQCGDYYDNAGLPKPLATQETPQPQVVPLSEGKIERMFRAINTPVMLTNWRSPWLWERILVPFARAIEAKVREQPSDEYLPGCEATRPEASAHQPAKDQT